MMLRRTTSVLFASLLLAGGVAATATPKPAAARTTSARTMPAKPMPAKKVAMTRSTRKGMPMARGGDAQNSVVDQLNAQSLQRAQTNPPTQ